MQLKRLTRAQKQLLAAQGMKPGFWQLLKEYPDKIAVKQRFTGEIKVVEK